MIRALAIQVIQLLINARRIIMVRVKIAVLAPKAAKVHKIQPAFRGVVCPAAVHLQIPREHIHAVAKHVIATDYMLIHYIKNPQIGDLIILRAQ